MIYELALKLGHASPSQMVASMRPSELGLWFAKFRLDPWGEQRADLRMGVLASLMANLKRDEKKRAEPFSAFDFMPYHEKPPAPKRDVLATMRGWFSPRIKKGP